MERKKKRAREDGLDGGSVRRREGQLVAMKKHGKRCVNGVLNTRICLHA